jgi:hypothetical protein
MTAGLPNQTPIDPWRAATESRPYRSSHYRPRSFARHEPLAFVWGR